MPVIKQKCICCLVEMFILVGVSISKLIPALEHNWFVLPKYTEIKLFGRFGYSDVVL